MSHRTLRPRYHLSRFRLRCKQEIVDRIGLSTFLIWAAAFAPLLDSVFFSAAASGQLTAATGNGVWHSVVFGAACFSGGASVAGALTLTGSLRRRSLSVLGVYMTVGVGILVELGVLAWTPWDMPASVPVIGAFVLLALAAVMMGWRITVQPFTILVVLLGFAGALSIREDTSADRTTHVSLDSVMAGSGLALMSGFLLTLTAAVLSPWLTRWLDLAWITKAGAASIATIALSELGLPLPGGLTIGILICGAFIPPVVRTRFIRRLRCWPRARRIQRIRDASRIGNLEVTS